MILQDGTLLNERYEIESMIGQGGMSYVYRALDRKMGREVAVKVLKEEYCEDEDFIRKFQNEAQAAAKLNHPNIVAAYDVVDDETQRLHYIVMELVSGITLKNYIQRKGRLNNRETIGIALQVIDGMEQAHKMRIVHRDIKPQNMIVGEDGVVKVADFGIARAATQQTVNATVMGSVHYISPEQARSGISDERSDIYSLGCTIYEMLTGHVPYDGDTSVAVVFSHLENPVPHVREQQPDVYPALDAAVYKCMQKKPDRRYQHIGELGRDLRRALEDPSGSYMDKMTEDAEGRALSDKELSAIREHVKSPVDHVLERLLRKKDGEVSRQELDESMAKMYRFIAMLCVAVIVVLLALAGTRLLHFLHREDAVLQTSQESTESSAQVSITISGLDTMLPGIIGKTVEEAEDYLSDYDIHVESSTEEYSDRYNEGMIISYPDGSYSAGDTIHVTVSKGAATISFYDPSKPEALDSLHATRFAELEKELKARNIPYTVEYSYSDSVAEGNVISTNKPDTGGAEQLKLVVSKGLPTDEALVPSLLGCTEEEALSMLAEAGLNPGAITEEPSDEAVGTVTAQTPAAGTLLELSAYVDFTVSAGADGESTVRESKPSAHWYSSINQTVMIGGGGPGITGTMVVSIQLCQNLNGTDIYTTLQSPRSYSLGTELQVVFSKIEGAAGVSTGTVYVMDAENDTVLASFELSFAPVD